MPRNKKARRKARKPGALEVFIAIAIDLVLWVLATFLEGALCTAEVFVIVLITGLDISPLGILFFAGVLHAHRRNERDAAEEEEEEDDEEEEEDSDEE